MRRDPLIELKTATNKEYKWFGAMGGTLHRLKAESFKIRNYHPMNEGDKYDLNGKCMKPFVVESTYAIDYFLKCDKSWKKSERYDGEDIHKVEYSNVDMFPLIKELNEQECTDDRCHCENEEWYCDDTKLTRIHKNWRGPHVFILSRVSDNSIITIYHNYKYHYVDGDGGTEVFFKNGNILMSNSGDAPSVLYISKTL